MQTRETILEQEKNRSDKNALWGYVLFLIALSAAVSLLGLYLDRLNTSQLIVNCGLFSSVAEATKFTTINPQYTYLLDPTGKGISCSSHYFYARGK